MDNDAYNIGYKASNRAWRMVHIILDIKHQIEHGEWCIEYWI